MKKVANLKCKLSYVEPSTQLSKWPIVDKLENDIKDCAISSNGGKSWRKFCCTASGIVAPRDSLINNLGGTVRILSTKRSSIPLWKKYKIVASLNGSGKTRKNIALWKPT